MTKAASKWNRLGISGVCFSFLSILAASYAQDQRRVHDTTFLGVRLPYWSNCIAFKTQELHGDRKLEFNFNREGRNMQYLALLRCL